MIKEFFGNKNVKAVLKGAKVVGAAIVIEGIKGVLLKTVANTITTSFDKGMEGVKKMTLEDYVGRKKKVVEVPKVESKETEGVIDIEHVVVEERPTH